MTLYFNSCASVMMFLVSAMICYISWLKHLCCERLLTKENIDASFDIGISHLLVFHFIDITMANPLDGPNNPFAMPTDTTGMNTDR